MREYLKALINFFILLDIYVLFSLVFYGRFKFKFASLSLKITSLDNPIILLFILSFLKFLALNKTISLKNLFLTNKIFENNSENFRSDLSISYLIYYSLATFFSLILFNGYILDQFGFKLTLYNYFFLILIEMLVILAFFKKIKFFLPRIRYDFFEFTVFLILMVFLYLIAIKPANYSIIPYQASVDLVHHYTLIDFIATKKALVHSDLDHMGEMDHYPAGAHLFSAFLAETFKINSLQAMGLTFILSWIMVGGGIFLIARRLLPYNKYGLFCSTLSIWLFFYTSYAKNMLFYSYYFSMVLAMIPLFSLVMISAELNDRNHKALIPFLFLFFFSVILSFPLWVGLLIPFLTFFLIFQNKLTTKSKINLVLLFLMPVILVIIYFIRKEFSPMMDIALNEGTILEPSIKLLGKPFALLSIFGLFFAIFHTYYSRHSGENGLAYNISLAYGSILPLSAISLTFFISLAKKLFHFFSLYIVKKCFYLMVVVLSINADFCLYFVIIILFYEIFTLFSRFKITSLSNIAVVLAVLIICLYIHHTVKISFSPVLSLSEYQVASWIAGKYPRSFVVPLTDDPLKAYFIGVGILKHSREGDYKSILEIAKDPSIWYFKSNYPLAVSTDYKALPKNWDIEVLFSVDRCAVIRKAKIANQLRTPP